MGTKSGCLFFCVIWLGWAQTAQAQWLDDRLHIRANTFFNVAVERGIVSGDSPLDKTASFLGTGVTVKYDVFQKGKHELFTGIHYGIMSYHRRYVPYLATDGLTEWEWDRLGRISQFGLVLGYRIWIFDDRIDQSALALEISGDLSRYQLEKSNFEHQFIIKRWLPAVNFQVLVRFGNFELGPFIRMLNQYLVERNYRWVAVSTYAPTASQTGQAYSKHGRLQFGLMIGYRL
jgi:hypothetical protein